MKKIYITLFVASIIFLFSFSASADLLYDNGVPLPGVHGVNINGGYGIVNSFALTENSKVESVEITIWDQGRGGITGQLTWGILPSKDSNISDGIAFGNVGSWGLTNTIIGQDTSNNTTFNLIETTFNIAPTELDAGTTYWLSISGATGSGYGEYWARTNTNSTQAYDQYSSSFLIGGDAFRIYGTPAPVPEPATMLLLGSGLIGLAGLWRKFKK
jgi:hypothetical protein